ncbi:MAG: hypothetical protein RR326_00675 [Stenotrophomonas sp.]
MGNTIEGWQILDLDYLGLAYIELGRRDIAVGGCLIAPSGEPDAEAC